MGFASMQYAYFNHSKNQPGLCSVSGCKSTMLAAVNNLPASFEQLHLSRSVLPSPPPSGGAHMLSTAESREAMGSSVQLTDPD